MESTLLAEYTFCYQAASLVVKDKNALSSSPSQTHDALTQQTTAQAHMLQHISPDLIFTSSAVNDGEAQAT